ncbi:cytochrome c class I [Gluconacetobacter diazotrophicus PA1 5]|uniref:C-type cytochrome n=2 Tax=Gluconacetobacter diazotrophicus TaxID=33996 RepID=A0A7W4I520_GLUDI|nr:c-type cytochrome [Gluconacetobacter diazotrophicus]ACI49900.1 cytochrome c class I [Gluconacetobacter diazotrophicus PA1 5]MBB2156451.1 c-type cytochrome [Gluconacetobacter diazotrophicus]TWB05944.1 cytochrome c [Gluconacetobacter diazotrophicus]CAP55819.1 putative cytochrome c homolog [Gluconacetobacter diazotrophicus PA1 5]
MDSKDVNRIGAAILVAALALGASAWAGYVAIPSGTPGHPAFVLPQPAVAADASGPAAAPPSIADAVAHADPKAGQALAARMCAMCHSFAKDGPAMIGPDLYGVPGTAIGDMPGYEFSAALAAHKAERWTDDALSSWLEGPGRFAPGTRMAFPGVADAADRAAIIAFLHTLSDGAH